MEPCKRKRRTSKRDTVKSFYARVIVIIPFACSVHQCANTKKFIVVLIRAVFTFIVVKVEVRGKRFMEEVRKIRHL